MDLIGDPSEVFCVILPKDDLEKNLIKSVSMGIEAGKNDTLAPIAEIGDILAWACLASIHLDPSLVIDLFPTPQ